MSTFTYFSVIDQTGSKACTAPCAELFICWRTKKGIKQDQGVAAEDGAETNCSGMKEGRRPVQYYTGGLIPDLGRCL